jgi:hypothetical protein
VANWIERICEPRRLFLAWQAPDHLGERFRWAVGVLEASGDQIALRYLQAGVDFESRNQAKTYDRLLGLGYQGYPAFSLAKELHTEGVLSAFMRRLPPRARSDFEEYKAQFRLPVDLPVSDLGLLGVTEAKLPSDGFSLVDPLDGNVGACDLMLEVAGYRHYPQQSGLSEGDPIRFQPEPENKFDPNAVMIQANGQCIGYINRLQAPAFQRWLAERDVSGVVERLNGRPEKPRAFIFVRVRPGRMHLAA